MLCFVNSSCKSRRDKVYFLQNFVYHRNTVTSNSKKKKIKEHPIKYDIKPNVKSIY